MEIYDIDTLQAKYVEACESYGVAPHASVSTALFQRRMRNGIDEPQVLELCLDHMVDADVLPLITMLKMVRGSELEAVDVLYNITASTLKWQLLIQLLRAASQLRVVDLKDSALGRDAQRELFQGGLECQSLDLSLSRVRKLDMVGQFPLLHTLKLDFSYPVTSLPHGCFRAMPKLAKLSMCGTGIANLWTTCSALLKLPCLSELRFQKCMCCQGTGQCTAVSINEQTDSSSALEGQVKTFFAWQGRAKRSSIRDWVPPPARADNGYESPDTEYSYSGSEDESDVAFSDDESADNNLSASSGGEGSGGSEVDQVEASESHLMETTPEDLNGPEQGADISQGVQDSTSIALEDGDIQDVSWGGIGHANGPTRRRMLLDLLALDDTEVLRTLVEPQDRVARDPGEVADERMEESSADDSVLNIISTGTADLIREVNRRASFRLRAASRENASERGAGSSDEGEEEFTLTTPHAIALSGARQASPICYENHYRDFMISTLPGLQVLDNLAITATDRERARAVYKEHFELAANNRRGTENLVQVLKRRETGGWGVGAARKGSQLGIVDHECSSSAFCRSLSSTKMASCAWPATKPICRVKRSNMDLTRRCRPRQFEYHPTDASLMVFGTLHGEVVVVNHESDKMVGYVQSIGAPHSILGLCWLNKDPNKLIAGSDNGSLQLYDVNHMRASMVAAGGRGGPLSTSTSTRHERQSYWAHQLGGRPSSRNGRSPTIYTYDDFEQLTSVHINSADDYFLASGYSKDVGLYDLRTGTRLQIFPDLHQEHINVVKFAHHSPYLFATSSFDKDIKMWDIRQKVTRPIYTVRSTRGNVMVCFSRDDHYLLSSAVDNEVRQHLAVDGRLHMKFDIAPMGSSQNYTRSYYLNGRDYIITGSCEENVIRVCCSQTGRRLRDLTLEGRGLRNSLYVQSLRGDPFRDFHFSVLVAYNHPHSRSEIVKVNLHTGDGHKKGHEVRPQFLSLTGMGA